MSLRVVLANFDCLASQVPLPLELLLCVVVNVSSTILYKRNLRRSSCTHERVTQCLMASGSSPYPVFGREQDWRRTESRIAGLQVSY
jgi:hypothetical protein